MNEDPQNQDEDLDEITQVTPEEAAEQDTAKADLDPLVVMEARLKEMQDKYLRASADFDNFRKRVAKEKEELVVITSQKLLVELLDVKDHLELALSHASSESDVKVLKEGVSLTLKQLQKFLEKCRVEEIDPRGHLFDPAYHEAIQEEATDQQKPGTVVTVYQKGYLFQGKLLRPARVTVASEKK